MSAHQDLTARPPMTAAPGGGALLRAAASWQAWYAARGGDCAVFPLQGKTPLTAWRDLVRPAGKRVAAPGLFGDAAAWEKASGYAVAPAAGSRLAIIDVDDGATLAELRRRFPALAAPDVFTVATARGTHLPVLLYQPLEGVMKKGNGGRELASLRGHGAYVVGPGSAHESGATYRAAGSRLVELDAFDTAQLLTFLEGNAGRRFSANGGIWSNPDLVAAVIPHLERRIGRALKFSRKGTAPFRAWWRRDRHASAFFSRLSGCVFDAGLVGEGGRAALIFSLKDLCVELGVDPRAHGGLRAGSGIAVYGAPRPSPLSPSSVMPAGREECKHVPEARKYQAPSRAELIAAGYTQAARLLDCLGGAQDLTRSAILSTMAAQEWSEDATDRALHRAIMAGLMRRAGRGRYQLTDAGKAYCASTSRLEDLKAYQGRPADYRRAVYQAAIVELRPGKASWRQPSTAELAERAGVTRSTGYRYDRALGVKKIRVLVRRPFTSGTAEDFAALMNGGPVRFDAISSRTGASLFHVLPACQGFEAIMVAFCQAQDVAARYGGHVATTEYAPSLRLLPGEQLEAFAPAGVRLEANDHMVVDLVIAPSVKSAETAEAFHGRREVTYAAA